MAWMVDLPFFLPPSSFCTMDTIGFLWDLFFDDWPLRDDGPEMKRKKADKSSHHVRVHKRAREIASDNMSCKAAITWVNFASAHQYASSR